MNDVKKQSVLLGGREPGRQVWGTGSAMVAGAFPAKSSSRLGIYMEISKLRLTGLAAFAALAGFLLAGGENASWSRALLLLLGVTMASAGSSGFNQWIEKDCDARMFRTRNRPLPAGRIEPDRIFLWSSFMVLGGIGLLLLTINPLTAFMSAVCVAIYVGAYTPLKRLTPLNTLAGAVCGGVLPLGGWAAAAGRLEPGAWILAAILFVWQIPHFLALACLYRDDYRRGGFQMLPSADETGEKTCRVALLYSLVLVPVTLLVVVVGLAGWIYFLGAAALGALFVALALGLYRDRTLMAARRLFLGSIAYLQVLLALMLLDPTRIF